MMRKKKKKKKKNNATKSTDGEPAFQQLLSVLREKKEKILADSRRVAD